eukprot:CAMPEP_0170543318 /NCGR_PEP_ID=MMETSP0211-20121228/2469_1 /TAXON_ID=311385 /ORGANISM="Pseudokeronopsis sp., Strain OXSARD2" /LENGTH=41 /DNA_ID= /DNA_START= /DNA_END= /DNA_ORIENTATION=
MNKEDDYMASEVSVKKTISLKEKELSPIDKLKSIHGESSQG